MAEMDKWLATSHETMDSIMTFHKQTPLDLESQTGEFYGILQEALGLRRKKRRKTTAKYLQVFLYGTTRVCTVVYQMSSITAVPVRAFAKALCITKYLPDYKEAFDTLCTQKKKCTAMTDAIELITRNYQMQTGAEEMMAVRDTMADLNFFVLVGANPNNVDKLRNLLNALSVIGIYVTVLYGHAAIMNHIAVTKRVPVPLPANADAVEKLLYRVPEERLWRADRIASSRANHEVLTVEILCRQLSLESPEQLQHADMSDVLLQQLMIRPRDVIACVDWNGEPTFTYVVPVHIRGIGEGEDEEDKDEDEDEDGDEDGDGKGEEDVTDESEDGSDELPSSGPRNDYSIETLLPQLFTERMEVCNYVQHAWQQ